MDLALDKYLLIGIPLGSFLVAYFLFPSFIRLLERKNLLDSRDHRKLHERDVPGMGGVIFLLSTVLSVPFFFPISELINFRYFLGGFLLIFIVGLRDDIVPLSAGTKLISQLIPVLIVLFFFDLRIESLYTLASIQLPLWFQVVLTAFTMIIIINSFNLIDGVDGLAGSLSVLSLVTFAIIFFLTGQEYFSYILLALAGAVMAFLIYNWSPARIFMGDNGALLIGFTLGCASVLFIRSNSEPEHMAFRGSIGTAMSFIALPLYDMFRIIIFRIFKRRRLMEADRNHLHHLVLALGFNHSQTTLLLFALQFLLILNAWLMRGLGDLYLFSVLAIVLFGFNGLISLFLRRKAKTKETGIQQ